jgi:spermidine/putrescine ABC transporter ATP-binding subunit
MTTTPSITGTPPLVEVRGVSRHFGEVVALDGVSLDIRENEFFALLGPSGCGKTTLLRVLAGFEYPDDGELLLGGEDLLRLPPNRRPLNLMFQSYALFPHMTVAKNVAYGLERERLPKAEIAARVTAVLHTVGLLDQARRRPRQLSGGQRQRVALARAIVKRPRLLLLDEPLSALDRKVRSDMQLELKRLQHEVGITFVVVTHDQEEAMSMADRVAVMNDGRIEQIGTPAEIYRRPGSVFVADFIGTSNIFTGRLAGPGVDVPGVGTLPGQPVDALPVGATTVHLVIRPEEIRLTAPGQGLLSGRVVETQFVGGVSTIAVAVAGTDKPVLVTLPGLSDAARDDDVGLDWLAPQAVLLAG